MICRHKLYHFTVTVANTSFTAPLTGRGKTKFATIKWYNLCQQIIQSQTCYPLIMLTYITQHQCSLDRQTDGQVETRRVNNLNILPYADCNSRASNSWERWGMGGGVSVAFLWTDGQTDEWTERVKITSHHMLTAAAQHKSFERRGVSVPWIDMDRQTDGLTDKKTDKVSNIIPSASCCSTASNSWERWGGKVSLDRFTGGLSLHISECLILGFLKETNTLYTDWLN